MSAVTDISSWRNAMYLRGEIDYASIDAVNYSTLKELARSPKHYQYRIRNRDESTAPQFLGTAAHTAILEPDRFMADYAVFRGARRAGKEWDAFEAANSDKSIIKLDEFESAIAMRDAVRSHTVASTYLERGHHEVSLVWSAECGTRCKGRADFITNEDVIVDVKTTKDASPFWFARDVARYQYHVQAAFYADGLEAITMREARAVIIAVESKPPHDVVVYRLDEDSIGPGRDAYRKWLDTLRECRAAKRWPGYADVEMPLVLPPWAAGDEDDLEALGLE